VKVTSVDATILRAGGRLDAWYFLSPADDAIKVIERAKSNGLKMRPLGGKNGCARLWKPGRSKAALAAPGEPSVPYLRPYDVFNYYPEAATSISALRTVDLHSYQLRRGTILQTCSGRNLGPSIIVDKYLEQFVIGSDMIRIDIDDKEALYYVFALLNSQLGRHMLRRNKTGSVIDHLDPVDLAVFQIPDLPSEQIRRISQMTLRAFELRENARLTLHRLITDYEAKLPPLIRTAQPKSGWTISSIHFRDRLDAAYYDPMISEIRAILTHQGGKHVADVATVRKPSGRFKTRYVDTLHGLPLLSGTQLLQSCPINLQYMSPSVYSDVSNYELRMGWIAYPADGRAEQELGTPVLITSDRDGWLASGHIGRIIPNPAVDVGWLFLALKTTHTQMQLKATASGSVVDSTFPADMEAVVLPPQFEDNYEAVLEAWQAFSAAQAIQNQATSLMDQFITEFGT
jgi:hypothetical protein